LPDRVLLISYAFPPLWAPEAILSAKRMASLPGYEVDVICAVPPAGYAGDDRSLDAYVADGFASVARVRRAHAWDRVRFGRFAGVARPPDEWRLLNGPARRAAGRRLKRGGYAAVVTWSQPHSTHLVGRALRRRHGVPWIAHLSDPWVRNPFVEWTPAERRLNERLERGVFAAADRLLFTSSQTVELSLTGHPDEWRSKARVLPHAYEPSLYPPADPASADGRVLLRYLGAFYGPRSPRPLAAALARLDSELLSRLRVEIVGRVEDGMMDAPEIVALPDGVLTVRPPVDYVASLGLMREADGLLVVDAPAESSPFLPSKLVDYVGAGRPIAALTPPGAAADLVARLGGPVADPSDADAGAAALRRLVEHAGAAGAEPFGDPAVRAEYEAERVRAQMADVVREVSSRATAA
jgi:glycosyltransferase involved in cell wall biosynthesis